MPNLSEKQETLSAKDTGKSGSLQRVTATETKQTSRRTYGIPIFHETAHAQGSAKTAGRALLPNAKETPAPDRLPQDRYNLLTLSTSQELAPITGPPNTFPPKFADA